MAKWRGLWAGIDEGARVTLPRRESAESARTGSYRGLSGALKLSGTRAHARISRVSREIAENPGLLGGGRSLWRTPLLDALFQTTVDARVNLSTG